MRPFIAKDGRYIIPTEHIAKFIGKRNASKGKTLIILSHNKAKYLTPKEIHARTGLSLSYLYARLTFWYRIRYVDRKALAPETGRPVWTYRIGSRGLRFIRERMPMATYARYLVELKEWQDGNRG
jgi:hypothetical protein